LYHDHLLPKFVITIDEVRIKLNLLFQQPSLYLIC